VSVIERLLHRDGRDPDGSGRGGAGEVSIAMMRRRDLRRGVLDIESVSYPRPWSIGVFESEIAQMRSGSRRYLVARRRSAGGRSPIVGYAGVWFAAGEGHVTNVAVDPAQRRTGVATALLLALADAVIAGGCAAWTLEVRVSSTGAQALYRRFGFAPAGVRTQYYENTEDAIVMWCNDIQGERYSALLASIRAGAG
jgi:ribosomal-protein-alanine N-acetyltransferase